MDKYHPAEIIQLAIRIEENGRLFYQELAQRFTGDKPVYDLFNNLAEQEDDHRQYFEELAKKAKQEDAAYPLSADYFEYLRGFADPVLFTRDEVRQAVEEVDDLTHALEFCMMRELEAVQYYQGLSRLLVEDEQKEVALIVAEEQRHYDLLSDQRKRIVSR